MQGEALWLCGMLSEGTTKLKSQEAEAMGGCFGMFFIGALVYGFILLGIWAVEEDALREQPPVKGSANRRVHAFGHDPDPPLRIPLSTQLASSVPLLTRTGVSSL